MAGEYIFNLENLTKQHGAKTILEDVNLAFFFGARIGVIGSNGSGKSSLLRIMAGLDKEYLGNVNRAKSATVGYLEQEPQLDPTLTVQEIVAEGVAVQQAKLDRYDELAASPDIHLEMDLRKGDIQFISNHTIVHARSVYEDEEAPEKKRHLLRLWLSLED